MAPKSQTTLDVFTESCGKALHEAQMDIYDRMVEAVRLHCDISDEAVAAFHAIRDEISSRYKVKTKKPRGRTAYHEFLSEKMLELKETEPDLDSKGRLVRAQQLYKESKVETSQSCDVDDGNTVTEKKTKKGKSKKVSDAESD